MNNIIFLDIDGVLNCKYTKELVPNTKIIGIDNDKIKRLKKIVNNTNSNIILISSWKFDWDKYSNRKIQNQFGDYLDNKLFKYDLMIEDKTIDESYNRGKGIIRYLNGHIVNNYIILDDSIFNDYNKELMAHLIQTKFEIGLSDEDVEKAIKILKN